MFPDDFIVIYLLFAENHKEKRIAHLKNDTESVLSFCVYRGTLLRRFYFPAGFVTEDQSRSLYSKMTLSKLVLGTVQFGLKYGISNTCGQTSFPEVCRILEMAYEHGIMTLDTAAAYGESESVLGKALQRTRLNSRMNVVSKVTPLPEDLNEAQAEDLIRSSLKNSLENLRMDSIHTLLFHRERDWKYASVLEKIRQEGVIRFCGCSMDGAVPQNSEKLQAVQVPGNLLDRRFFPFMRERKAEGGTPCHVYVRSVYLQGLLLMKEEQFPDFLRELLPYRRKLANLAAEGGMTLAELCVRYLCSFPEIDGVLTGVETAEQLKMNLQLAEKGPLDGDLLNRIEEMIPQLPEKWIRPSLWK